MRVNEIFYTLQGEGRNTGCAAVFVRLSGCNLQCPFCDTRHEDYTEMSEEEIAAAAAANPAQLVVITGGEPALQLTATLVARLHALGKAVAIETNGTRPLPDGIDWVTVSPKAAYTGHSGRPVLTHCNELKVVFDGVQDPEAQKSVEADYYYLQPCDTGDAGRNEEIVKQCVDYIKQHPEWRLSLQTHKLISIP